VPTKDELVTFASDAGIDVSASWTKAEIEAAVDAAGYDPLTLEPYGDEPVSEINGDTSGDEVVSTQAQFSTYAEAAEQPDTNPPTGKIVEQTLGPPSEGPVVNP
jgi:hypothetical protein